jgi:signal transduction histidine kinase
VKALAAQAAAVAVTVGTILAALLALGPGQPEPIAGAALLTEARLCADPRPGAACTGPVVPLPVSRSGVGAMRLLLTLPPPRGGADPTALYLPGLSEALELRVDGLRLVSDGIRAAPRWNRPTLVRLPRADTDAASGRMAEIVLRSAGGRPLSLQPVHHGPLPLLEPAWRLRTFFTAGMAGLGVALIALAAIATAVLALARPHETIHRWALLAGMGAMVLALHYTPIRPPIPPHWWLIVWTVAVPVLIAGLQHFVRRFLRHPGDWLEPTTLTAIPVALVVMLLVPEERLAAGTAAVHITALALVTWQLITFVRDRRMTTFGRFAVLYGLMAAIAALALHDAMFLYLPDPPVSMQLGQAMPILFLTMIGWLVLLRLVVSLNRQETLARILRERVAARSSALRATEEALRRREREALLAAERQRIMMDLHDGVGGHLSNALAGLRGRPDPDPALRDLLEEAQVDLGLIVDSLQHRGDADGLLAMFRMRVEPLLARQGLSFDWRVEDGPHLPDAGPGAGVTLLRIVQEFVSNTVKHANARHILVETGAHHLSLSDDGAGFDPAEPPGRGQGLRSMRRRAASLGAEATLRTAPGAGVTLRLDWPSDVGRQA